MAEPKYIKLQIDADPSFAAAAGAAVRCFALSSGLSERDCAEFERATVEACLEAFAANSSQPHIVELSRLAGRIEVVVDAGASAIHLTRPVASHG